VPRQTFVGSAAGGIRHAREGGLAHFTSARL
jgi:hypothetical protein